MGRKSGVIIIQCVFKLKNEEKMKKKVKMVKIREISLKIVFQRRPKHSKRPNLSFTPFHNIKFSTRCISTPKKQPQEKNNSDELNLSANDHTNLQRIHNLENQLQHVQEHNHELEAQSEQLRERLTAIQNNEFFQAESEQFQQKMKSYQEMNEELQEENYRIEILKNEYRVVLRKCHENGKKLLKMTKKGQNLAF